MSGGEHAWLSRLGAQIGPASSSLLVGIGDDAAVLRRPEGELVWTVDACVEGVHFTRAIASLEDVGYRSFMAAISDVAAMGAAPIAALSALVVPKGTSARELDAIAAGQAEAARDAGTPVAGGNISSGAQLSVTTTVLGSVTSPLLRSGAKAGDGLWVAGKLGLAGAGLRALLAGRAGEPCFAPCIQAFLRPRAQLALGPLLVGRASACIDVSDGLAQDAGHLARAGGVRLVIDASAALQCGGEPLLAACEALSLDALTLALSGGEDYALLVTSPVPLGALGLMQVGRVERGEPGAEVRLNGTPWRAPAGFDHL